MHQSRGKGKQALYLHRGLSCSEGKRRVQSEKIKIQVDLGGFLMPLHFVYNYENIWLSHCTKTV